MQSPHLEMTIIMFWSVCSTAEQIAIINECVLHGVSVESADGKRPSTEDDESVEFSFPIVHIDETSSEEGFPHSDSYGHQSRVTPERGKLWIWKDYLSGATSGLRLSIL